MINIRRGISLSKLNGIVNTNDKRSSFSSGIRNYKPWLAFSSIPKFLHEKSQIPNYCSTSIFSTSAIIQPRQVRVFDCNLNYVEMDGNPDHVVFILPGALSAIELDFIPLLQSLDPKKYKAIAFDPPGYGKSRPPNRWELDGFFAEIDANYATKLLEELGHKKYSLLGWSMGGSAATMMAVRNPERVRKMVVWGMLGHFDDFARNNLKMMASVGINCIPKARLLQLLEMYGKDELTKVFYKWLSLEQDEAIRTSYCKDGPFTTECLNQVSTPTLVIQGSKDGIISQEQISYLHKNIKCSKMHLIQSGIHATHGPPTEEEFLSIVDKFLASET